MTPKTPLPPDDAAEERKREWAHDSETDGPWIPEGATGTEPSLDTSGGFLIVRHGQELSLLELHDGGEWIVGRSADAHVVVKDQRLSRRHAKLAMSGSVLTVEDLGSRNGTSVNGRVLRKGAIRIATGDLVQVGGCQLVVATRAGRVSARAQSESPARAESVDIVLADAEMARLYERVRKVAPMMTTVLILGETGSGKDVLAQRLHQWSPRAAKPFVRINCAGIPESLLESELFGYERGAFTGAERRKPGYFEAAQGGTILLDEIGELSASAQAKLLNVLETRTVTSVGGTTPLAVDVRVVCATHRDLQAMIAEGRFRADLYYRISPFTVKIPPLRARALEIPLLAKVFLMDLARQANAPPATIDPEAIAMLTTYAWPGNVRELRNAVEYAFVMAEGTTLRAEHFAPDIAGVVEEPSARPNAPMRQRLIAVERQTIEEAIAAEGGNQTRAAMRLGMPRRTLVHRLMQYRREKGDG